MTMGQVVLGAKYLDKFSGFQGTAIGVAEYLDGPTQALLCSGLGNDGKPLEVWLPVNRLELVG